MNELIFLKLGGSLITEKSQPYTVRLSLLADIAAQIAAVRQATPSLSLVLGHGSGSFGHTAAKQHGTKGGVSSPQGWQGFSEVWFQAATLNRHVMQALHTAGLPAIAFAPVSSITAKNGQILYWNLTPIQAALKAGLIPVVYGDVIFDEALGGTILSTEDLFEHLAYQLKPKRILLAGIEEAVWADFPAKKERVSQITPSSFNEIKAGVGKSQSADVTGGMESKVKQMLNLIANIDGLTAEIFSGEAPNNIQRSINHEQTGTLICK